MKLFPLAALFALLVIPAAAQTPSPVGQWGCESSYSEINQRGERSGNWQHYNLAIYQDGTFQVSGVSGGAAASSFQGQGQWQMQQSHFIGQGQIVQNWEFMPAMNMGFQHVGVLTPDGMAMSYSSETPTPGMAQSRLYVVCQRQG